MTLRELIDGGYLETPVEISVAYKGNHLTARINPEATVTWSGTVYDSLSIAAAMARKSTIGTRPGRKYPQTNGWTFWRVRDVDGKMITVDVLRQRAFEAATSN